MSVHEPQPAAIRPIAGKRGAHWVWRCHIGTSEPNGEVWEFLRGFLEDHDAAIYTYAEFLPPDLPIRRLDVIPPAIDPLSRRTAPCPTSLPARCASGSACTQSVR